MGYIKVNTIAGYSFSRIERGSRLWYSPTTLSHDFLKTFQKFSRLPHDFGAENPAIYQKF